MPVSAATTWGSPRSESVSASSGRVAGIFALAVALACLQPRAVRCSALVDRLTRAVDDATWHSVLGFAVFLPFVAVLIAAILRTHQPLKTSSTAPRVGRWPVAAVLVPIIAVHLSFTRSSEPPPEPAYFAALSSPPGHELVSIAPSQEADRATYETPWLIGARFQREEGRWFDLLHYNTLTRPPLHPQSRRPPADHAHVAATPQRPKSTSTGASQSTGFDASAYQPTTSRSRPETRRPMGRS